MSWYRWLRNLLGARAPARPKPTDPLATVDLPAPTAIPLRHGPVQLLVGVVTTVGNYRDHNEDNYFVPGRHSPINGPTRSPGDPSDRPPTEEILPPEPPEPLRLDDDGLFIVADGMGGQLAGEKASQMAVELIPRELGNRLSADADDRSTQTAIRAAVAAANREILALSHLGSDYNSMGTTVVLALFRQGRAFITGLGDSRAYRLRDGRLEQLTEDHSLAKALEKAGTITPEEEETHKFRHVLYLYLGSKDARDGPDQVRILDVRPGDRFLLASDGLTGVVKDDKIAGVLAATSDPQRCAQVLVNQALENQSKDNITSMVIHVI